MESRLDRLHAEQVMDHYQGAVTAAHSMSVNDFVMRCNVSASAYTVTLPSVVEATGKFYTIKVVAGRAAGAAPYDLTITTKGTAPNKDAIRWGGDIVLDRAGESVVLFSDGEEWHRMLMNTGMPVNHTKHVHEMFDVPFVTADILDGGTPNTGAENMMVCGSGNVFSVMPQGTQTLSGPAWANPGADIAGDQTDNDGFEITHGVGIGSPVQFVIGTDPAFFAKIRFLITTVAGTDDCAFGLRKRAAYNATFDNYTDLASLNVIAGDINIETILNNAATTTTDTTDDWADGETHTLKVLVSSAGVVTYEIDDVAPTVTAAFTFDSGDTVIPFIHMLQANAAQTGSMVVYEWECGYQA